MADAPEVKVRLTAEDTGVSAAIKELGSQLKNLKTQQDSTASSAINLSSAFGGIAAVIGTLRLAEFGKDAFDSAVNIGKMADKTGLTTQTLSVFHKVAGDVGTSTEAVDKGLIKAAKSITQFEQGSKTAAQGFALLGISQKDFAGLNADKKIELVTTAIGKMAPGFNRATAAQLIFSKGGSELIPVMQALAAQGFDAATAATEKLGLLLDQDTTDAFRAAKASMQELEDAGKGVATQFEAGLLPAISDVADAMLESVDIGGKSGDGFREMGKVAGTVVRDIAAGFIVMGASIAAIIETTKDYFAEQWAEIRIGGVSTYEAIGAAARGHFAEAKAIFQAASRDITAEQTNVAAREKAVWDDAAVHIRTSMENLFPSDAEEARRQKERVGRLRPEKTTPEGPPPQLATPTDQAARAALSLLEKQLQDELDIHRAYAKQTEQAEKEMYDQGLLSLDEYFNRRRTAEKADVVAEVAILEQQRAAAQAAADKAAIDGKAATPKSKEADSIEARRLGDLQKVEELNTKITEAQIAGATKVAALDNEQIAKKREAEQETLAFERQIAELQGKRGDAAKAEIASEAQKRTLQVQQTGGPNVTAQLAEIETWKQLKLAVADYDAAKKKTEEDTRAFEIEKKGLEIKAKGGQLTPLEEEKQINELIKARLPLLQADAAAELGAAQKTGNQENVASAQNTVSATQTLAIATNQLGAQVRGALTNDFMNFFGSVGRSTQTMARQFEGLAASVVKSIEQMIEKQLLLKLLGTPGTGGAAGTPGVLSFLHLAEGGLIKGSGGPKADAIPARLSAGEFVMKADAVSAFGAHNLEAINRGLQIPSLQNLALPKFSEGGLVGAGGPGPASDVRLGIALDQGLILHQLKSKDAGRVILEHLSSNPKAAGHALSRSK